jgi:hypothetical protein
MHTTTTDLSRIVHRDTEAEELAVYVVATTFSGTRAALDAARNFAAGFDLRITLLVPHVVPYQQPLDHPADSVAFAVERYRRLAEPLAMDVMVRVCLCRSHSAALAPLIPRDTIVLVGGRCRPWWPTREQRVADALTRYGHHALFVLEGR